jgi:4,5-dihydroxyphthalate decarboxylase
MDPLLTLTRASGANRAVVDGEVVPAGHPLVFADEPVLVRGFRKMVRSLAYDVSEMALTTYLCAREHGVAFTALPVFLVRDFHHGAVKVRRAGRVEEVGDLKDGRVGVNRGYTVTSGVWARSVLATEYGLDLDSVTWCLSGDEHVADYRPPANVVAAEGDLIELLLADRLDAVIGVDTNHPEVVSLIPDAEDAGLRSLRERGVFPINHLLVVRDQVLASRPDLPVALFDAFAEAKRRYVVSLTAGGVESSADRTYARVLAETGSDPLPYGIRPNRTVLEELVQQAQAQHILSRPVEVNELFAPSTRGLVDSRGET